jgi:hypothetical protein
MAQMVFINLPARDLAASVRFYEAIGATRNPQFSDDTAACMVFSETIFVMLLTHPKWATFTSRPIVDARSQNEVMIALSRDTRGAVDAITMAAASNGGTADVNAVQDLGFMYGRSFTDPDGHIWEAFHMDTEAAGQSG